MNIWLIEIIHNIDIFCNVVFWWLLVFYLMAYAKSPRVSLNIGKKIFRIWLIALTGVIFIPSKSTLYQILG